jgi:DUF4097 and DUF4098 domain-containing protein YvlB
LLFTGRIKTDRYKGSKFEVKNGTGDFKALNSKNIKYGQEFKQSNAYWELDP